MRLRTALKHALDVPAPTQEGEEGYDSTRKLLRYFGGIRERNSSPQGYQPFAYTMGLEGNETVSPAITLAANGGTLAVPFVLESQMVLRSIAYRNTDNSGTRGPVLIDIFYDDGNDDGILSLWQYGISAFSGVRSPAAATTIIDGFATNAVHIYPGTYMLAIQNTHATNTYGIGCAAAGTLAQTIAKTKTISPTSFYNDTHQDFVTGWTAQTLIPVIRLNGRVFGQTPIF